jgi:hypothetical protein
MTLSTTVHPYGHERSPAEPAWRREQSFYAGEPDVSQAGDAPSGVLLPRCRAASEPPVRYTTSIRTADGRILVHVTDEALAKLHHADEATELQTLARHMAIGGGQFQAGSSDLRSANLVVRRR